MTLNDQGELSFPLDEKAAQASLGWLEKAIGRDGLKASILGGDAPVVFSLPVSAAKISWPKTPGGYAMKVRTDDLTWIVGLNYPSGGAAWQMINMISSRGTTRPWKTIGCCRRRIAGGVRADARDGSCQRRTRRTLLPDHQPCPASQHPGPL